LPRPLGIRARYIFAEEQQQTAKIDAEYSKRVREANEADDHTVEGHQETLAKIAALDDLRNAQMGEQANAMRDKLAGTLESAWKDPMGSIKDAMQHEMAEIVANWIMQLTLFKHVQSSILGGQSAPVTAGVAGGIGAATTGTGGILGSLLHGSSARSSAGPHSSGSGGSSNSGTFNGGSYAGTSGGSYGGSSSVGSYGGTSGGSYGGSSSVGPSYSPASGSNIGPTVSMAASDIPAISHDVKAARAQASGHSPIGAKVPPSASGSVDDSAAQGDGGLGAGDDWKNADSKTAGSSGVDLSDSDPHGDGSGTANYSSSSVPKGNTAATAVGDAATVGIAGYEGYTSTKADFMSDSVGGMMKGTLGDAMSGMAIGGMFGPEGALIGAGVGAAVGLFTGAVSMLTGEGGRLAARDYYKKSISPEIEKDRNGYEGGDFQSAISEINKTASDGLTYMGAHWGGSAAEWVDQNYLRKEQLAAVGEISSRAKGGAGYVSMSAKQFHTGTSAITDFGDLATSPNEGFIHALLGEAIVNPVAASTHGPAIQAMNSGASPADMASMYQGSSNSNSGGGDTHHHYNISAIDAKGFDTFLRNGGARQIIKHTNNYASQYAGDGISG